MHLDLYHELVKSDNCIISFRVQVKICWQRLTNLNQRMGRESQRIQFLGDKADFGSEHLLYLNQMMTNDYY